MLCRSLSFRSDTDAATLASPRSRTAAPNSISEISGGQRKRTRGAWPRSQPTPRLTYTALPPITWSPPAATRLGTRDRVIGGPNPGTTT